MLPKAIKFQLFACAILAISWSSVDLFAASPRKDRFITLASAPASEPIGHVRFCEQNPEECNVTSDGQAMQMNSQRWQELRIINVMFNSQIVPTLDTDNPENVTQAVDGDHGEVWSFFHSRLGDCEDYVLTKRRELIKLGWPTSSLLIAVVRKVDGDGHAILIARTNEGDFVLDNLNNEIPLWWDTQYFFIKAQSPYYTGAWLDILGANTYFDRNKRN